MNNRRRKELKEIQVKVEEDKNKLSEILESIKDSMDTLECIKTDEEEALSNLPENLSCSERADAIEAAISELEDAISCDEDIKTDMENIISYLADTVESIERAME